MLRDTNIYPGRKMFFDIAIDQNKKVIHLLDIGEYATSLTNIMDKVFADYIMRENELQGKKEEWKWVCYGTDCIISEYLIDDNKFILNSIAVDKYLMTKMIRLWGLNINIVCECDNCINKGYAAQCDQCKGLPGQPNYAPNGEYQEKWSKNCRAKPGIYL